MSNLKSFTKHLVLDTGKRREAINITRGVQGAVTESGINTGLCVVFTTHSTSAIIVNEDEEGLKSDVLRKTAEDFPVNKAWAHNRIDDNADAHLAGTYLGPSVAIPVVGGRLTLGTWQSIFFLEFDGPRSGRRIVVQVMGE
ncbi:MAG: secondary thiamine-phosphate synthase enzyme YjbQ [Candidatus Verstraetearchaeota archaeon]|nr:secondary thiamine-phosphate synthase enzyme YjbQ [Candidatus Verstraetearchaeota archaeon]